jgi:glycerol-3-phosphate cytidylyltransferase
MQMATAAGVHAQQKNVLVVGVFDLFHVGHVRLLQRAKSLGDRLIVAVNGDEVTACYKRVPIVEENARAEIVGSCRYVDETIIAHSLAIAPLLQRFAIDVIVHGNEWDRDGYLRQIQMTEADLCRFNVKLVFLPYTGGVSTSDLLRDIASVHAQHSNHHEQTRSVAK